MGVSAALMQGGWWEEPEWVGGGGHCWWVWSQAGWQICFREEEFCTQSLSVCFPLCNISLLRTFTLKVGSQ